MDRKWYGAPEDVPEGVPFEDSGPEVAREIGVKSVERGPSGSKMDCGREIGQVMLILVVLVSRSEEA